MKTNATHGEHGIQQIQAPLHFKIGHPISGFQFLKPQVSDSQLSSRSLVDPTHNSSLFYRRNYLSQKTKIEWADHTWNPTRGCTKISPGCKHCYAATFANRFKGVRGNAYERGFTPRTVPHTLVYPLKFRKRKRIFVNSMSDLFHPAFSDDYLLDVFRVMGVGSQHQFQILTKRAESLVDFLRRYPQAVLPNVLYGVTVENREHGIPRLRLLQSIPGIWRILSLEPLLEDLGELDLTGIDQLFLGGESGPGARPMEPAWVDSIHRQCREQNVSFFFKQWGGVRKRTAGRLLNGREYNEQPNIPWLPESPIEEQRELIRELEKKYQLKFKNLPKRLRG